MYDEFDPPCEFLGVSVKQLIEIWGKEKKTLKSAAWKKWVL